MPLFGPPNVDKLKAKGDVPGLIKALRYEKDSGVRHDAALALGKIGDARAVEPFIAALGDQNGLVRWSAAESLGAFGDARAVEPLIAALNDEESGVRDVAVAILGRIGGAQAVEPLRVALGHQQEDVRKADIWAGGHGRESGQ